MNPRDAVVALLQALIRIPSVNPEGGDPGTTGIGEARIAAFLVDHLKSLGAETELREVLPDRPNVLARFPSDQPGKPKLLLAPHTDTVSVAGMSIDPFGGEIRDGRIYGRGASDTKGTMAAMLVALQELGPERIATLGHEIWFAGLMGEETGLTGSIALAAEFKPDFVLVGEPTLRNIVHTHKGRTWLTIRTHGVAVHGSTPELGRNAITAMNRVISALEQFRIEKIETATDPILGTSTLSIGTIRGGSKVNIVPDFCELCVDIRTVPSQPPAQLEAALRALLDEIDPAIELEAHSSAPLFTDPKHPLVAALLSNGAKPVGAPWFCDAASFAEKGIPAVAAGPGSIEQAHTKDEWVDIGELTRGVQFYREFLEKV